MRTVHQDGHTIIGNPYLESIDSQGTAFYGYNIELEKQTASLKT